METIIWILLGIIYSCLAFLFGRAASYCCCLTHGEYHYNFYSIMIGLFFPITLLVGLILMIRDFIFGIKLCELI